MPLCLRCQALTDQTTLEATDGLCIQCDFKPLCIDCGDPSPQWARRCPACVYGTCEWRPNQDDGGSTE